MVGAGLCGLVAAARLRRAGADVVVVEAGSEVGGRTRSRRLGGRAVDVGGELVGRDYTRLRGLVAALGLRLEPAAPARPRLLVDPRARPQLSPPTAAGLAAVAARLHHLCGLVPDHAPWQAPLADRLDALSLQDWLDRAPVDERTARLLGAAAQAFTTAPPHALSLLAFLQWLKPAGGLSALWRETPWRIRGGAQQVAVRLAARLGDRVVCASPVQAIEQDGAEVAVHTEGGEVRRARRAAVCTPLAATDSIAFTPRLPSTQRHLLDEVRSPAVTKLLAASADVPRRGVLAAGNAVIPLAMADDQHAVGFAYGSDTALPTWHLRDRLATVLGLDADAMAPDGIAHAWHEEPYIGGGYPAFAPGQLTRHGPALRTALDRVHFAGADRGTWPGTMEGAVRDGDRVAAEIGTRLG
ncbi:flavin monoamine oxidase family protein [Streptomonospora wellingtoniae]|uniref:flavin monoamine oxidase family protein n=1 Tax=Streptomonospora wellingtoniae TaxID=3075544 RepID=UPI00288921A2|nr:FAD-dependent oxidoreductase [Streptomonospora sp. DSM 45055]